MFVYKNAQTSMELYTNTKLFAGALMDCQFFYTFVSSCQQRATVKLSIMIERIRPRMHTLHVPFFPSAMAF